MWSFWVNVWTTTCNYFDGSTFLAVKWANRKKKCNNDIRKRRCELRSWFWRVAHAIRVLLFVEAVESCSLMKVEPLQLLMTVACLFHSSVSAYIIISNPQLFGTSKMACEVWKLWMWKVEIDSKECDNSSGQSFLEKCTTRHYSQEKSMCKLLGVNTNTPGKRIYMLTSAPLCKRLNNKVRHITLNTAYITQATKHWWILSSNIIM